MFTALHLLLSSQAASEYLVEHKLETGSHRMDAVVLQRNGTSGGKSAIMIVASDGASKVVMKTTWKLFETAYAAVKATLDREGIE